jgi:hypothetical protein
LDLLRGSGAQTIHYVLFVPICMDEPENLGCDCELISYSSQASNIDIAQGNTCKSCTSRTKFSLVQS